MIEKIAKIAFLLSFPFVFFPTTAQEASDIILIDTKSNLFGFKVFANTAKKVTDTKSYDDQPFFINDLQIVFSSASDEGDHDIIMHNWASKNFTNMSRTQNKSEFSPSLTSCGQYISAVRVEEDSTQRLWLYPINMGKPELLYDDISPVGYYGWYNETAALFVLGEVNELVFPYSREDIHPIATNPGRCIQHRPKTKEVAFLDKNSNIVADGTTTFELKTFNVENREINSLGLALPGTEDFCWLDKNRLLMAKGKDIYLRKVNKSVQWEKVATIDLADYDNISRLSLSPGKDKLVVVMKRTDL